MKVSIVIPNWNGEKLLPTCLESLFKLDHKDIEVIVVDNNSHDDSVRLINKNFPQTKVIKLDENTGFSYAVNQGIKISSGNLICLLNNDTEVQPDWLTNLVDTFSLDSNIGIVTSKLINFYNRTLVDAAGDKMNIVGQAKSRGYQEDIKLWDRGGYVFSATGGASIYKREVFDNVGLFEETYYMYFEDADLCYRAQKAGFKVYYQPTSIVYHMQRASSNKRKKLLEFLLYRNFVLFYLINTPKELFFRRHSLLKFVLVFFNTFLYLCMQGNIKEAIRVWIWLVCNIKKIKELRINRTRDLKVSLDYLDNLREDKKIKILGLPF